MTTAKDAGTNRGHKKAGSSRRRNTLIGAIVVIIVAGAWLGYQLVGAMATPGAAPVPQAYFTDDDGKTVFADASNRICPFDHNGKQAVRAYCFTTDGGKTHSVGYLERWNAEGKRAYDLFNQRKPEDRDAFDRSRIMAQAFEVKLPGTPESEWTRSGTKKYQEIVTTKGGKKGEPYLP